MYANSEKALRVYDVIIYGLQRHVDWGLNVWIGLVYINALMFRGLEMLVKPRSFGTRKEHRSNKTKKLHLFCFRKYGKNGWHCKACCQGTDMQMSFNSGTSHAFYSSALWSLTQTLYHLVYCCPPNHFTCSTVICPITLSLVAALNFFTSSCLSGMLLSKVSLRL